MATIFISEVLPDIAMGLPGHSPIIVTIVFGESLDNTQGDKDPLDSQNLGSMGGCHDAPHPEEPHSGAAVSNPLDLQWSADHRLVTAALVDASRRGHRLVVRHLNSTV